MQAHADSTRSKQWFLDAMHAEEMWRTSTGAGITVAVIDTGVDPTNPDLKGRVLDGKDLAPTSRAGDEHTDYEGHGTGMAGLIAGTGAYGGGNGAFGLAPGVKILPIRMPGSNDVNPFAISASFGKAIRYAADSGAKVINISMGGASNTTDLTEAVKYALRKGSLVFGAVGNKGDKGNPVEYPGATPGVVGVAAVGKDLKRAAFSEYGPQVDISAPGTDMVHACGGKTGLCKTGGTSDATALASASAALIWSKHPTWTNNQVLRVMLNTIGAPTNGAKRNDSIGYGIVRPRIALQNPGDPGPADVYPLPDLAAAETTAPAKPSSSPPPSGKDSGTAQNQGVAAGASSEDDGGNGMLWIGLGAGAVVVVGGAVAAAIVGRRRRSGRKISRADAVAAASRYLNTTAYPEKAGSVIVFPDSGIDFAYGWTFRFDFREHMETGDPTKAPFSAAIVVPHSGASPHLPPTHLPVPQYMEMCASGTWPPVQTR